MRKDTAKGSDHSEPSELWLAFVEPAASHTEPGAGPGGAPQPAAAPQLALAQLPKVAEGVAGGHGRLVVGMPTPGSVRPGLLR